ncbi:hypothetical protein GJW-30_1_04434 [Variibacter gotjawalensis]|uniref:Cyclic nucleotide-binding domain-containing protein n=1 Tax=Variibacter gotjawalensis TaxID=1333996 RepID=A0A0S3Q1J6_9BRAD|nr:Crp/Fnr family transcriptional regulator [Variibacter gotjawalensis]NIK47715.1 CRP-like cAMP-binding protein [Variibacter gotjawalensis]RZS49609.1 CRP-like cAMP-binding protein [Variibacter gotjawalensis]BAT61872.1 hypothetical protein GJW-30_1_04434 [Variibacter gotjawalensis]
MRLENEFLLSLTSGDLAAVRENLTSIELSQKTILIDTGDVNEAIYFPQTGIVSYVARMAANQITELAMIGIDGMVGGAAALGADGAVCDAIVQIPVSALAIRTKRLRGIAKERPSLFEAIRLHEHRLSAEFVRAAGCLAAHTLEQRLARWLLRARALSGNQLAFTQAFMSEMLTVRRASVSVAAEALQAQGAIEYARGQVTIRDAIKLKFFACSCANGDHRKPRSR